MESLGERTNKTGWRGGARQRHVKEYRKDLVLDGNCGSLWSLRAQRSYEPFRFVLRSPSELALFGLRNLDPSEREKRHIFR